MGLDVIEIVMALEKEFELQIPDKDAMTLARVGEISDYIVRRLQERGESPKANEVFERVKNVIVKTLDVEPERVSRETHFIYDLGAG
jgi:acyl carrier protein